MWGSSRAVHPGFASFCTGLPDCGLASGGPGAYVSGLMDTLIARGKALCLLVALLGGSFVLPLYDAAAFHSRASASGANSSAIGGASRAHHHTFTHQTHGATCALGLITLAGRGTPSLAVGAVLVVERTECAPLTPAPVTPDLFRSSTTRSRAPPAISA